MYLVIGLSEEECEGVFRVLAGILHLGNIEFELGAGGDSESSSISTYQESQRGVEVAGKFLGLSQGLTEALVSRTWGRAARGRGRASIHVIPRTKTQAEEARAEEPSGVSHGYWYCTGQAELGSCQPAD